MTHYLLKLFFFISPQSHSGPRVPETGDRHGHHVGGGRAVVGDRRAGLRVVPDGRDEHAARGAHIHRGRLSASSVDGREAHVVPAVGQPVGRRQRPVVHVQRDAVHRQRVHAVQTGGHPVLMTRPCGHTTRRLCHTVRTTHTPHAPHRTSCTRTYVCTTRTHEQAHGARRPLARTHRRTAATATTHDCVTTTTHDLLYLARERNVLD